MDISDWSVRYDILIKSWWLKSSYRRKLGFRGE